MPSLAPELRKQLENIIPNVRKITETAAGVVLETLAVNRPEPPAALSPEQRQLRNRLRARARALGDGILADGLNGLKEEIAYQQWHRMVFARFLAENGVLMHPSGVAVTLLDCAELAIEEGDTDAWETAARYAAVMLPGIFDRTDPSVMVRFAPEGRSQLEMILNELPAPVFRSDDALGWMYQFWQKNKKDEVNASERKIGGADLAPVTQLFTEDYMVRFLLENSLGAWWASRHPNSPLIAGWKYLRFVDAEGVRAPAAGTFAGWPERAAGVTLMDPCCGSGHFLVAGFEMLMQMRMEEEGLGIPEAGDAILRDNLFGLELDPRCAQIAAFALALAAWRTGGYRQLPVPNVACSGIAVQGQLETWLKLAGDDSRLRAGLERLYNLFKNAPDLGSLINPTDLPAADRMFIADYEQVSPLLERALAAERRSDDPVAEVFGASAEGVAKAARLLAGKYTLVITNVPYLARGKQSDLLKSYCDELHPLSKADLATTFVERSVSFCQPSGTTALVSPQNWLFLTTYSRFRKKLLEEKTWNLIVRLGSRAFETISGEVVNVVLTIISNSHRTNNIFSSISVENLTLPSAKALSMMSESIEFLNQSQQLKNPDIKIIGGNLSKLSLLGEFAYVFEGMHSGDYVRFGRKFWEIDNVGNGWSLQQGSPNKNEDYSGREHIIFWENGKGVLVDYVKERLQSETVSMWIKGYDAWGKRGVAISPMSDLKATLYSGQIFTHSVVVIIPQREELLGALWHFCQSEEFRKLIRHLDKNICVAVGTFGQIPFDVEKWTAVAEAQELPETYSNDPSQWLFKGQPGDSSESLQVAVARLLGYQWPQQEPDELSVLSDADGIVCLPSVAGEKPLAERLRLLLAAAYGEAWSPRLQAELLAQAGAPGKSLEEWLRDEFFARHCRVFQNRPFIWHIWDGRKDGFSALVNYHKLDATRLDKLIYTYLGDWIRFQRARRDHGEPGADGRLIAALELEKKLKQIKEGEPPYDIYIRWKPLGAQPLGWTPDLNDGVRLNIRPFVNAGILRSRFTINWNKDRGKNPDGSERLNDLHYTVAEKRAAHNR